MILRTPLEEDKADDEELYRHEECQSEHVQEKREYLLSSR